ncbi:ankyrin repeat domain-containing protein 13D [Aplysia californica]|uniref:Ankyrin repeat domain-containing protein 13D n=1 Tax=Aplysia californica TaxID=6500 RepID=A0ABM0JGL9_APLCA|nr:ankyrin repeat domain-containing protein 13D [Aplysia californica]
MAAKTLKDEFPIHWLVWHNSFRELDAELEKKLHDIELVDPRGRTPLHLSVTLGNLESARVLLRHGANANAENKGYWSALHEAVCTGDPEMVQLVLQYRDFQRYSKRTIGVPDLLKKLQESPDFYVEMKWEFTSWVPLISRMCPSDTYKVWKKGSSVRIDTTLLGFDNMTWQRGSRSYIFKVTGDNAASIMEVDHDIHEVYQETIRVLPATADSSVMRPSEDAVAARLTSPACTTYIDTDRISFERSKSGIWGWRSDKTESVNGYECKVFTANNVELVTKTRTEHLAAKDKVKAKKSSSKTPLESFLGATEETMTTTTSSNSLDAMSTSISYNPGNISPEEYFSHVIDLGDKDIGRPIEQSSKVQKFKASLWLCEGYPLSLQEQVIPIIDLMAQSNAHFAKLRDFITLQLPAGFPIKIEIPLFHVLNARITFGNIQASEQEARYVTTVKTPEQITCSIEEECFNAPASYGRLGGDGHHERLRDEDDELLQFAIQQSLVEQGTENEQVTFYEALNKGKDGGPMEDEDKMLQRAIAASFQSGGMDGSEITANPGFEKNHRPLPPQPRPPQGLASEEEDDQLRMILELSKKEQEEEERRRKEEEEELQKILELSLMEK